MSRRGPVRVLGLFLILAILGSAFVANADAKISKHQKAAISKKLMRAVKHNPRVVSKRWFLKQASLVNWSLPATIRLLPTKNAAGTRVANAQTYLTATTAPSGTSIAVADTTGFSVGSVAFIGLNTTNENARTVTANSAPNGGPGTLSLSGPLSVATHAGSPTSGEQVSTLPNGANKATLDLGPSLGSRTIGLGGYIKANINFNDAFNGGNLGDVKLTFPSGGGITTTSVGLLANPNVNDAGDASSYRAPENTLYSAVVGNNAAPLSVDFGGTPVPVTGLANDPNLANNLEAAIASLTFPGPPSTVVGSQGVYVNVTPIPSPPAAAAANKITIEFGGPNFNGVNVSGLNLTSPAPIIATPLAEDVQGDSGSLDLNGQGGCAQFDGNGSGGGYNANIGGDVDKLGNMSASMSPGGVNNVGPGPSFGGSGDPADTVLRTGPLTVTIADTKAQGTVAGGWTAGSGIPGDSSDNGIVGGVGTGIVQPAIGPSGGKANLFGSPVHGLNTGHAVDVTVNLATSINSIERQVDGGFPAPNGKPSESAGNVNAYANCRQAWTGAIQDYLTNIHLVGDLKISPAVTADGKLRIARAYLKSQAPAEEALAACLSPYQLFLRGNGTTNDTLFAPTQGAVGNLTSATGVGPNLFPTPGDGGSDSFGFNPLTVLTGSGLPSQAFGGTPSPSAAPGTSCDAAAGPLNRPPFNVSPLSNGSLSDMLTKGAAVAVRGDLTVNNLNAEVLVGNVPNG